MKRGQRCGGGGFDAVRDRLLGGEVAGTEQAEAVDEQHLFEGRAAGKPAILELRGSEGPGEACFATSHAGNAALHQQSCRNNAAPGGDAIETVGRLFGVRVEVPSPARECVEECRAITAVGARQDIGRIGRPEEDPLAPELRRPRLVDFGAVSDQPTSENCFRQPSAVFAGRRSCQVAEPGETLQLGRERPAGADRCEIEVAKRNCIASNAELSGQEEPRRAAGLQRRGHVARQRA